MSDASKIESGRAKLSSIIADYRKDKSLGLTQTDLWLLQTSSGETITAYVENLRDTFESKSNSNRSLISKLFYIVDGFKQYEKALDVLSNIQAMPMSLIWGLMRVVFQILERYRDYFLKVASMFALIRDLLPRYEIYGRIFGNHDRVREALARVYEDIQKFCEEIRRIFIKKSTDSRKKILRCGFLQMRPFLNAIWTPFESNFDNILTSFRDNKKFIEEEVGVAGFVEGDKARKAQEEEIVNASIAREENRAYQQSSTDHFRAQAREIKDAKSHRESLNISIDDKKIKKLQDWLCPVRMQPRVRLNELLSKKHPGTNGWILNDKTFNKWQSGSYKSLWIVGIPGAGKSVLAGSIIDSFKKSQSLIAYFFCSFNDRKTLEPYNVIGNILSQMVSASPEIRSHIQAAYDDDESSLSLPRLQKVLHSIPNVQDNYTILIDGLDEMDIDASNDLIEILMSHREDSAFNPKLVVISRLKIGMEAAKELKTGEMINLEEGRIELEKDIERFASSAVERKFAKLAISQDTKTKVTKRLVKTSKGMFQLVRCQIESLKKARTEEELEELLDELPTSLHSFYEEALERIKPGDRALVRRVLLWLAFSERPLTLRELAEAVCIQPQWESLKPKTRFFDYNAILESCGSFVSCDERKIDTTDLEFHWLAGDITPSVKLAHFSVSEFLLSDKTKTSTIGKLFALDPFEGHLEIASICLVYSCFADLDDQSLWSMQWGQILRFFPLLQYSATEWYHHVRYRKEKSEANIALATKDNEAVEEKLFQRISTILTATDRERSVLTIWISTHARCGMGRFAGIDNYRGLAGVTDNTTERRARLALYYAIALGLKRTAQHLIENGFSVHGVDSHEPPILTASRRSITSQLSFVKLLIDNGAHIMAPDHDGNTVAHIAALYTNKELLEYSVQVGGISVLIPQDKHGMTPFLISCEKGDIGFVKLMLEYRKESIENRDNLKRSGLQFAWKDLQFELSLFLRQKERECGLEDSSGASPLHWSVFRNEIVETYSLLKDHANVEARDIYNRTPLHIALQPHHQWEGDCKDTMKIIALLLKHGSNPATIDDQGNMPLGSALTAKRVDICELILSDEHQRLQNGESPTWLRSVTSEVAMKLIKSITLTTREIKPEKCDSPDAALAVTLAKLLKMILLPESFTGTAASNSRGGIDVALLTDEITWHAMHYLVWTGRFGIPSMEVILEAGGDVDVREMIGRTPLHHVCEAFLETGGYSDLMEFLLSKGADITAVGKNGFTVLMYAAECSQDNALEALFRVLQDSPHKATIIEALNELGETALMVACRRGSRKSIQILMREGFSPLVKNFKGEGILQIAVKEMFTTARRSSIWEPDIEDTAPGVLKYMIEILREHEDPDLSKEIEECCKIARTNVWDDLAEMMEGYSETIKE